MISTKTPQEKTDRVIDDSKYEGMTGLHSLKADNLLWNQLTSNEGKNNAALAGRSSHEHNKVSQTEVDSSLISKSILKGLVNEKLGSEIKFSVQFPGSQSIDVHAVENKNFWNVNFVINDSALKQKIKRLRKDMEYSICQELDKRVVICVK